MPRLPRVELEGAVFFVTCNGLRGQVLFKDLADCTAYLKLVRDFKKEHPFKLFAYALLPAQIHLLIETSPDVSISQIMHHLSTLYTKYFNARYHSKGHLFEARFRSILAEKATMLVNLTRALHRFPSLSPDYPHSSFTAYRRLESESAAGLQAPPPDAIDLAPEIDETLKIFQKIGAGVRYEQFCSETFAADCSAFEKSIYRKKIIGSAEFVARAEEKIAKRSSELKQAKVPLRAVQKVYLSVIAVMVMAAGVSTAYLYTAKRSVESQYQQLLAAREAAFAEQARFENQNPLGLADLEGTQWTVEISSARGTFEDTLRFENGRFESAYFAKLGFKSAGYFLVPQGSKKTLWQSAQSTPQGDALSWRGTWQGDAMKGQISFRTAGQGAQDYTFFSKGWEYGSTDNFGSVAK